MGKLLQLTIHSSLITHLCISFLCASIRVTHFTKLFSCLFPYIHHFIINLNNKASIHLLHFVSWSACMPSLVPLFNLSLLGCNSKCTLLPSRQHQIASFIHKLIPPHSPKCQNCYSKKGHNWIRIHNRDVFLLLLCISQNFYSCRLGGQLSFLIHTLSTYFRMATNSFISCLPVIPTPG